MTAIESKAAEAKVVETKAAPPSGLSEFWFYFSRNKGAVLGLAIFLIILFVAIFAPLVAPHDPSQQNREVLLLPPAWTQGGNWSFVLGTDAVGRDILSRLIYGARFSLGPDGDVYLVGRVLLEHLTVEELDRIIGVLYELTDRWFQPVVRLAYPRPAARVRASADGLARDAK